MPAFYRFVGLIKLPISPVWKMGLVWVFCPPFSPSMHNLFAKGQGTSDCLAVLMTISHFFLAADQVYGDQDMHEVVRKHCMDYLVSEDRNRVTAGHPLLPLLRLGLVWRSELQLPG